MVRFLVFAASWCGPCRSFKPFIEEASKENNFELSFLDIENDPLNLVSDYNITSVPTTIIIKDDKEVNRFQGVKSKADVTKLFLAASND